MSCPYYCTLKVALHVLGVGDMKELEGEEDGEGLRVVEIHKFLVESEVFGFGIGLIAAV